MSFAASSSTLAVIYYINTYFQISKLSLFQAEYLSLVSITLERSVVELTQIGDINIKSSITNKGEKGYNIARVVKSSYFYSNNIINHYCSLVTLIHEKIDII